MREKLLYIKNGKQISGPFSQEQLDRMRQKDLLTAGDMISDNRISWRSVEEFFASLQPEKITESEDQDVIQLTSYDRPLPPPSLEFQTPDSKDEMPTPEEKKKVRLLPDPVSAAIAMCWNAPGELADFYFARKLTAEKNPDQPDHNTKYFSWTVVIMLIVILGTYLALTGFVMPEFFLSLGVMPLVLFLAVVLLIFIENLFLASGIKQETMVETPLMLMQMLFIALPVFIGGLPLYALLITGMNKCPILLTAMTIIFCTLILFNCLFNAAAGFWQINYHVFKFKRATAVALIILFALQHIVFYVGGLLLYKFI